MSMHKIFALGLLGLSAALLQLPAHAQTKGQRVDFGKREFEANCASCHGMNGKGSGPVTPWLKMSPPDLTLLSKNNQGILPINRLYDSITGDGVKAHGSRDMPVWGQVYRTDAASYYMEVPYDAEAYVRARILALVEYINRLQVK